MSSRPLPVRAGSLSLVLILFICGCTMAPTARDTAAGQMDLAGSTPAFARPQDRLTESLFKDDQAVISNEDIARILSAEIELATEARLAVVRFGQLPYWWGWSEDFVRVNQQIDRDFLERLGSIKRLEQVSYLPTLVTPTHMTIPHLRQAAARCQADLLLVYRTSTHSYDRQRIFSPGEVRAYCTVEAIVLDTRTGTIPFSTVVTEAFTARRNSSDLDFSETIAKANQQAISKAWLSLADEVKTYFNALPQASPAAMRAGGGS